MKKDRKWLWVIIGVLAALLAGYMFLKWWNRDVVPIKTAAIMKGEMKLGLGAET